MFEAGVDIVTCTPAQLPWFVEAVLATKKCPANAMVVDEAGLYRTATSKRSQALRTLYKCMPEGGVLLMSGSPAPNSTQDLWSFGSMLSGGDGFWGSNFHPWRARWFTPVSTYGWAPKRGADQIIRTAMKPLSLSVDLRDASDVPRELQVTVPFDFSNEHNARIERWLAERTLDLPCGRVIELDEDADGPFLTIARQLTSGFVYHPDTKEPIWFDRARLDTLGDVLAESSAPKLVAIAHRAEAQAIAREFHGVTRLDGDTPMAARAGIVERFNADQIPVLCISPASAGHGLNLQLGSADAVVWFAHSFSHELRSQTNARLIRTGQKKIISVISLMATTGIDQAVMSVLERKSTGEAAVIEALKRTNK
jgi:hypothetical protein